MVFQLNQFLEQLDQMENNMSKDAEIICPSCKSSKTERREIRKDNGVMGSGYSSWVVDSWYSCKDCGVRFDLINKNK